MKKNIFKSSNNLKYVLGYWVFLVISPFLIASLLYAYLIHHYEKLLDYVPAYIMFYVLFIAPFLYFIPYELANPKKPKPFIIYGVVIPYLFIYLSVFIFLGLIFKGGPSI